MEDHLRTLGAGPLHSFATWKRDAGVPHSAMGVYTIWWHTDHRPEHAGPRPFVYVGIAGCGPKAKPNESTSGRSKDRKGLWSRLRAHASGRRGGDQFAVYVADRIILPMLSREQIDAVAAGTFSIDAEVKSYVAQHLAFRWVAPPDAETTRAIEVMLRRGQWEHGKPFLNPM